MASEFAAPKAPQAEVISTTGHNATARVGAYTDTARTKRNVVSTPATIVPPKSTGRTLGSTRPKYAPDKAEELAAGTAAQTTSGRKHAPVAWAVGRDPYANGGMIGQGFFKNGGN